MPVPLWGIAMTALASTAIAASALAAPSSCPPWPLWQAYSARFIQADGRVIDYATDIYHSTSEGQAYALFFALVANDRPRFDRLLRWTTDNLAGGDLRRRLPAWQWGRRNDGSWDVVDANSASDADLWLAYALLQAARLWRDPNYGVLGRAVLSNVRNQAVAELPGLGPMILPGAQGFKEDERTVRLNPSYLPIQLLRAFAAEDRAGPWQSVAANTLKFVQDISPLGFVPDWAVYKASPGNGAAAAGNFDFDPAKGSEGSFDAIRVYLWAGMLHPTDRLARPLLGALGAMREHLRRPPSAPPLRTDARTGAAEGDGPVGFSAAVLPYLSALGETLILERQRSRTTAGAKGDLIGENPRYYDQVLAMFGLGWLEGRFRFEATGQLAPQWETQCRSKKRSPG